MIVFFKLLLLLSIASPSMGQNNKHHRVAEVESQLNEVATKAFINRFPETPVLIDVKITPLRRNQSSFNDVLGQEELPYYSMTDFKIIDEWDDPQKNIHQLMRRVQRVDLKITLPKEISDDELFELRDSLFKKLHLVSGRDEIKYLRKDWQKQSKLSLDIILLVLGLAVLFAVVAGAIARFIGVKIESGNFKQDKSDKSSNSQPAPSGPAIRNIAPASKPDSSSSSSQLKINDTMQVTEKLKEVFNKLESDAAFPNLKDMIEFEKLAETKTEFLGSLLKAMSKDLQEKVFQRGKGLSWLECFFSHAPLDTDHYSFAQSLSYRDRSQDKEDIQWEETLISAWRLDKDLPKFIESLPQEEAFAILGWMPPIISIPIARAVFPGSWGSLLEASNRPEKLNQNRIKELQNQCLEKRPFFDLSMLEQYIYYRDLLDLLKVCSLTEERDIYRAARSDSSLHSLRKPFYPILGADSEILDAFITEINPHDWGVALANIEEDLGKKILDRLEPAHAYIAMEARKAALQEAMPIEEIWQYREQIADQFALFKDETPDSKTEQGSEDENQVA